jgi:hypothetical protein
MRSRITGFTDTSAGSQDHKTQAMLWDHADSRYILALPLERTSHQPITSLRTCANNSAVNPLVKISAF